MGNAKSKVGGVYNGEDMMLYWVSGSPACFRVMIALEEKKIRGYKEHHLNFAENEHKSEEVCQYNTRGQVPTFHHKGQIINESMAICEYLQHMYPKQGTKLTGSDTANRVMLQKKYESQNLQKKVEEVVYYIKELQLNIDKEELAKRKKNLFQELKIWEDYLKQMAADSYISSSDFTFADLAFFPYLAFCVQFGLSLDSRLPRLTAYYARCSQREAIQRAWPHYWKLPVPPEMLFFAGV